MDEESIYFKSGTLLSEHGDVRVYEFLDDLFLEIGPGHNLFALESELQDYMLQLASKPRGNVLEIGLGLGVASRYILTLPKVRALTTVEENKDVINAYEDIIKLDQDFQKHFGHKKHTILNVEGLLYLCNTKRKYDFVFIDFYNVIDEDTLPIIKDMVLAARKVLSKDGQIVGWFDQYTPDEFVGEFNMLFGTEF